MCDQQCQHKHAMAGGFGEVQQADETVQALCDAVKAQFLEQSGVNTTMFEAISYRKQVVAGTNYLIKVKCADEMYAHILVFQPLPGENKPPSLISYQLDKSEGEELVPFDEEEAKPCEGEEGSPEGESIVPS
ncbi:stefin-C-like [Hyperolius riggenbachi]|uniref:stefin-C-like n=1 Tax=Hyperolius riggenbachi TaxID=752182 RepID=UPI0035A2DDEA